MIVKDYINIMANLSIMSDNLSDAEREIFLQYLNLAHMELYQYTANVNNDLMILENINQGDDLTQSPFLINVVCDTNQKRILEKISFEQSVLMDRGYNQTSSSPLYYYSIGKKIVVYPGSTIANYPPLQVLYVPQPSLLTEIMEDTDLPYPLAYVNVLLDGALYYLFQDEGGFKNSTKAQAQQERWEKGKVKMFSYLNNAQGNTFSTFSII